MESEGLSIIDTPPFRAGYCVPEAYMQNLQKDCSVCFSKVFEIGIPAGIAFHTCFCNVLQHQFWKIFTHMQDAIATVVCLLFVLWRKQYRINKLRHIWIDTGSPTPVVSTIF